jgi:tetratricopeptide (TPR) repeat protein
MREAAELRETSAQQAPLGPGDLLPASELLGDMLLEHAQFEEAIAAYETALARHPNRFNSLYGAGRAAELGGDREAAADYYGRLVELSANAGDERTRVAHARGFAR